MGDQIVEKIITKYKEDREKIKDLKRQQAEELQVLEEFQAKREEALLERAGVEAFSFFTDLFLNGRDGKAEAEKKKENISLNQTKIEAWLLKNLATIGESVKTEFGTVYKARRESVTCADFEIFVKTCMLKDAAEAIRNQIEAESGEVFPFSVESLVSIILGNMHLELLTKGVRKESILEIMGDAGKDGSRPKPPPAGVNYSAVQTVGVRKATGK